MYSPPFHMERLAPIQKISLSGDKSNLIIVFNLLLTATEMNLK